MRRNRKIFGFALYEVLLGLTIFVVGVFALGRAVQNCINAGELSEEENRVRQVLSNRMAELQATPARPDSSRQDKIDTGYGIVTLVQKSSPAELTKEDDTIVSGITRVTLTAEWTRGGVKQDKSLVFYVYRAG